MGKRFRLGLYGGTFDPVHIGHLINARDALEQGVLDEVVWVPCAQSPHKLGATVAPAADRLAMLRAAIKGVPKFRLSDTEIRRGAPSYAIDTVREFRAAFPDADLFWLIGADQLPKLRTWHRLPELRRMAKFLLLDRPAHGKPLARARLRQLYGDVISLPRPRWLDISATEIRDRAAHGLPVAHLTPPAVAAHIARRSLYQKD